MDDVPLALDYAFVLIKLEIARTELDDYCHWPICFLTDELGPTHCYPISPDPSISSPS